MQFCYLCGQLDKKARLVLLSLSYFANFRKLFYAKVEVNVLFKFAFFYSEIIFPDV